MIQTSACKTISLNNGWDIDCITYIDSQTSEKFYSVRVCIANVPWREVVEEYSKIKTPDEANNRFKEMRSKYLASPVEYYRF